MKKSKLIGFMALLVIILTLGACGKAATDKKDGSNEVPLEEEILTSIKEEVAKNLEEHGVEDALSEDGQLAAYIQADLLNANDDNAFFIEKMDINVEDLEAGFVLAAMMNVNSDEIILLKAKDETKVKSLEAALESNLKVQTQMWEEYLPDQFEKVKNNIIKRKGNYLIYITYEHPEKLEEVFDQKLK